MVTLKDLRVRLDDAVCGRRVVFHHVPKCGGTSVSRALRFRYPSSFAGFPTGPTYRAIEALNPTGDRDCIANLVIDFRQKQLLVHLFSDVRCVAGHVRFSEPAYELFHEKYQFITTLRDPVSLLSSLFFYDVSATEERWKADPNIELFLETPRAALFGAVYAHFFSGLPPATCDPQAREVIDRAKANLARFAVVGLTDDMERFERRLREVLGTRIRIGHRNKARVGPEERGRVISPAVRKKIEALSAVNLEIYDYARRNLAA